MIRKKRCFVIGLVPFAVVAVSVGGSAQAQRGRRPGVTSTTTQAPTTAASTTSPTTAAPTTQASTPTTAGITPVPSTAPPLPVFNNPNVFYVSPSGKNENPGTRTQPWLTLQKAADTLRAGQTVLVESGTYTEGLYIQTSGTPRKPITFKAAPGAKPMIKLSDPNAGGIFVVGASYIRIQGFDVSYVGPSGPFPPENGYGDGIDVVASDALVKSHHVEIIGNRVHGFPGGGIGGIQGDYMLIEGNAVWGNSFWSPYNNSGISLYQTVDYDRAGGYHNIIRSNTVFGNANKVPDKYSGEITDGNCIIIDDQRRYQNKLSNKTTDGPYQSSTLVENNICAGNGGRGVHVFNSDNVMVRNNTMYQNMRTPGLFGGEMTAIFAIEAADIGKNIPSNRGNVRFVNNIAVSSDTKLTEVFASTPADEVAATFDHNFYFGSSSISKLGDTDIVGNAQPFVSPSTDVFAANFRLNSSAWAIDRALPSQSPGADVGGIARPQGDAPDMGAWEYVFG